MSTEKLEHVLHKTADRLDVASQALIELGADQAAEQVNVLDMVDDLFWHSVNARADSIDLVEMFLKRVLENGAAHSLVIHGWAVKLKKRLDDKLKKRLDEL